MTLTRARTIQYVGILLSLGLIAVGYWYFSARAGVKTNTSVSQPQGTGRLDSGLAGYWKFDEGTGSTVADSSVNGNNGTQTGGMTWTTGQIGGAGSFDGSDDKVTVTAGTGVVDAKQNVTLSAWVYFVGLNSYNGIIYKSASGACNESDAKYMLEVGLGGVEMWMGGSHLASNVNPSTGQWSHIVATNSSGGSALYLNGTLIASGAAFAAPSSASTDWLFGSCNALNGRLDEVRIYDRGLSADEVGQLYRLTTPTAVDTSLKGYWSFDGQDISGTTAFDRSGAGNTGTLTNGPTVSRGVVGQALSFDGGNDYIDVGNAASLQTSVFTYAAWINPTGSSVRTIKGTESSSGPQFRLTAGGALEFLKQSVFSIATSTGTVTNGVWSHVAITYDVSGNYVFYINGIPDSSGTSAQTFSYSNVQIGIRNGAGGGAEPFAGSIDEFRIYNRVLSAAELKAQYDAAKPDRTNSSASQAQGMGRLDSGLLGYWPFDNGSGTTASDLSTNGNNGTLTNGPTWTTGQIGGAISFDGTNDGVNLGDINLVDGISRMTISSWIRTTSLVGAGPTTGDSIVSKYTASTPHFDFHLNYNNDTVCTADNSVGFTFASTGQGAACTALDTHAINVWEHWVMVYDGSQTGDANRVKIYKNGVQQTLTFPSAIPATLQSNSDPLYIGSDAASWAFNGTIDEVRIYDRVLSVDEVGQLYRLTTPTGVDTGLKGYWAFNGSGISGTTAYDRSGAGNTGTLTNGPTVARGRVGQSLNFDGVNDYMRVADVNSLDITGAVSLSAWVKPDTNPSSGAYYSVIVKGSPGAAAVNYQLATYGSGSSQQITFNFVSGTSQVLRGTTNISLGEWHHLVATYDDTANDIKLYVDGVQNSEVVVAGSPESNSIVANAEFLDIAGYNADRDFFDGLVDEVRVYNRVLSAAEVKVQYDAGAADKLNTSVSTPQGGGRLDSGLTGYWKLDENTGLSAADASTGGNTGTITGGPTWTTGRIGSALSFDGVNDYVTMGDIDATDGGKQLTAAAWIKQNGTTNERHVIDKGTCDGGGSWELMVISGEPVFFLPSSFTFATATGANVSDNQWHHIAGTYDGANQRIYVDGRLAGTTAAATTINSNTNSVEIGGNCNGAGSCSGSCYWNGQIDEARVYNRTLSADEIAQLYNVTTPTGTDTGLEGYWSFNGPDTSGTTTYDRSGLGNNGTLTGGAAIGRGKLGQALSFDGGNDYVTMGTPANLLDIANLSVCAWIKRNTGVGGQIVSKDGAATGWALVADSTNQRLMFFSGWTGGIQYADWATPNNSLPAGEWIHVCATYVDGSTANDPVFYINGVSVPVTEVDTPTGTAVSDAGMPVNVGTYNNGSAEFFGGLIDEVRIYSRILTAAEIQSLYNSGK